MSGCTKYFCLSNNLPSMEINNGKTEESFIPDIIPPELREPEPSRPTPTASGSFTVLPAPKSEKAIAPPSFYVHHTIIGLGIAGASALVFLIPTLKPITKVAIAGLGMTVGALLVYDDLQQHWESGCDVKTIFDFTPCIGKVTVVKKP